MIPTNTAGQHPFEVSPGPRRPVSGTWTSPGGYPFVRPRPQHTAPPVGLAELAVFAFSGLVMVGSVAALSALANLGPRLAAERACKRELATRHPSGDYGNAERLFLDGCVAERLRDDDD